MHEAASAVLGPWSNFYIMTGSSAAALTGLMFVVITLVSREQFATTHEGISTFSTPTVLHFCAALLIAALLVAPWHSLMAPALLISIGGLYGVSYVLRATMRARRLETYEPDMEDWISYTALPLTGYGAIAVGAMTLPFFSREALFAVAGGATLLLFIGIRNSWDIVTYIVTGMPDKAPKDDKADDKADDKTAS